MYYPSGAPYQPSARSRITQALMNVQNPPPVTQMPQAPPMPQMGMQPGGQATPPPGGAPMPPASGMGQMQQRTALGQPPSPMGMAGASLPSTSVPSMAQPAQPQFPTAPQPSMQPPGAY